MELPSDEELLLMITEELQNRDRSKQSPPPPPTPAGPQICASPTVTQGSPLLFLRPQSLCPLFSPKTTHTTAGNQLSSPRSPTLPSPRRNGTQASRQTLELLGLAPRFTVETGRTTVVVRVRPFVPEDQQLHGMQDTDCVLIHDGDTSLTLSRLEGQDTRDFSVDYVMGPGCTQMQMYQTVALPIVNDVLTGFNGTILAYGQTGTGKTYTMFGPSLNWDGRPVRTPVTDQLERGIGPEDGVIPTAVHHIFQHISAHAANVEFNIIISCLELYMESIIDLLEPGRTNLQIREDPVLGIYVDGLTQVAAKTPADVFHVLRVSAANRSTAATHMNHSSSRSHVVILISVEQRGLGNGPPQVRSKRATLTIVDLAGSERVAKSGSDGRRLDEAKIINRSLAALGNCVSALTDPSASHIPFRDSKLTRLLTNSLGGNSKTCLCATIGPSVFNYDESVSTLFFATRAMRLRNNPVVNEMVEVKESLQLKRRVEDVQTQNAALLQRLAILEGQMRTMAQENKRLRDQHRQLAEKEASVLLFDNKENVNPQPRARECPNNLCKRAQVEWVQKEAQYLATIEGLQADVVGLHLQLAAEAKRASEAAVGRLPAATTTTPAHSPTAEEAEEAEGGDAGMAEDPCQPPPSAPTPAQSPFPSPFLDRRFPLDLLPPPLVSPPPPVLPSGKPRTHPNTSPTRTAATSPPSPLSPCCAIPQQQPPQLQRQQSTAAAVALDARGTPPQHRIAPVAPPNYAALVQLFRSGRPATPNISSISAASDFSQWSTVVPSQRSPAIAPAATTTPA
eukprot:TRINITY_DN14007_c0_g1_i2.p1 TRINITY_DN14007_c0_g1~~TRINITY_DN14007_c0_g1_i2.p1  ORF type:complete len:793 (-),score=105.10 TRINITY_DN14007_c0_g1_i2:59-2437(-)